MTGGGLGIAHLADIESLAGGPSGRWFAATDRKLDRRVAVRVLDRPETEAERDRFDRDAKALGQLSAHPNIVTVYDAGFTSAEEPYLILELLPNRTLADHLQQHGPLAWEQAADLALQICAGIEPAHEAGRLHRDLRPVTIRMAGATPKLLDVALIGTDPVDPATATDPASIAHLAPESLAGTFDQRSDLYSIASVLYEMIEGRPPFWRPDDSVTALRLRLLHDSPPHLPPEVVPPALDVFIAAALATDPLDRPQTADEFSHELRLIREGRTTGSNPSVLHGTTTTMPLPLPPPSEDSIDLSTLPPPVVRPAFDPALDPTPAPALIGAASGPALSTEVVPEAPSARLSPAPGAAAVAPGGPILFAPPTGPAGAPPAPQHRTVPGPPAGQPASLRSDADTSQTSVFSFAPGQALDGPSIDRGPHPAPLDPAFDPAFDEGDPFETAMVTVSDPVEPPLPPLDPPDDRGPAAGGRSWLFLAAVGMIILGLVTLGAVAAIGWLGWGGDDGAAPSLPDPEAAIQVDAGEADGEQDQPTVTSSDGDAMVEGSTTIAAEPEQMSTTETTVPQVEVPNLVGLEVGAATKRLSDAGFQVLVVGRTNVNAAPGTVTGQKPDAGSLVTLPLTVTVYIPKVSTLPAMVGRSADAVCLELQALLLRCSRIQQNNDQVPVGAVIATNPVEGSLFSEGTTVELFVSRGPVMTIALPNVAGLSREDAATALNDAGFTVVAFAAESSATAPLDLAIGTEPAAGTLARSDQPITVRISAGPPEQVTVPELTGLTAEEASGRLTELGLVMATVMQDLAPGDANIGKVLTAAPAAGSTVANGSTVTVTIGQEAQSMTTTTTATTAPDTTATTAAPDSTTTTSS